jgi:oligopeptidase A
MTNPLLEISFRVPFDKIRAEHVEPAIDELLADAARRLDATIASDHPLHHLDTLAENLVPSSVRPITPCSPKSARSIRACP